jgi:tricorn protease
MIALPIPAGNQWELNGVKDGVTYLSAVPGTGNYTFFKFDLASRKAEPVYTGPSGTLSITPDGSKLAILSGTTIRVMDLKGGGGDGASKPDTSGIQALIDPRQEWRQIFWDSWRFLRDDFYDPAMGGLDWRAIGKRYEAYLPYVAHRSDLNTVLSMMNNELGTSHAYVGDGDLGPSATSVNIGHLGADYQIEGNHIRLAKIYYGEAFEDARRGPLGEPGFRVDEGSYLLEIDGIPVTSKIHPDSLLVGKANRYVTLTVNSTPSLIGAKKVRVQTVGSEDNLRYYDWIETTRQYVNKASGGRIGFVHVPSVLHDGAAEFMRGFYGQTDKDALIVDERWNVGGYFIQQLIVEMLNRKILIGTQFRNIQDSSSIRALDGPKVMLINEYAGSGGDSFPWAFRAGGAGKLIGRRTMGALVGVNNTLTLIDGGYVTAPDMGVYDPKTGLLIAENVGVPPDIEVDMRPDLVAQGKDPQLDAAIKHLMDELAKLPKKQPRKDVPRVQPHGRVGG